MPADTQSLAALLARSDTPTLTPDQTELLRNALSQLATSQALIARQQALLESFASDTADIETAIAATLDAARQSLAANTPLANYNAPAAQAARAHLLDQLDSAASLDHWLDVILRFVATLTLPASPN